MLYIIIVFKIKTFSTFQHKYTYSNMHIVHTIYNIVVFPKHGQCLITEILMKDQYLKKS